MVGHLLGGRQSAQPHLAKLLTGVLPRGWQAVPIRHLAIQLVSKKRPHDARADGICPDTLQCQHHGRGDGDRRSFASGVKWCEDIDSSERLDRGVHRVLQVGQITDAPTHSDRVRPSATPLLGWRKQQSSKDPAFINPQSDLPPVASKPDPSVPREPRAHATRVIQFWHGGSDKALH